MLDTLHVNPRLAHHLLVALARAHHAGDGPRDWHELGQAAGGHPSRGAVNRAISRLAEAGLIEGVHTPAGWLDLRPTARGLGRAGRAGRTPQAHAAPVALLTATSDRLDTAHAPLSEAVVEVVPRFPRTLVPSRLASALTLGGTSLQSATAAARRRTAQAVAPRMFIVRTQLSQAWHLFTSLP